MTQERQDGFAILWSGGAVMLLTLAAVGAPAAVGWTQCLRGSFAPGKVAKTTGNLELDQRFNQEASQLAGLFGVSPNLFLLDDSSGANAYASCESTLPGYFGSVFFGAHLIAEELWRLDRGPVAVAGVMAHEWAHILQCSLHSALKNPDRELHADYLAGHYLANTARLAGADVGGFARSLFSKGDYNFTNPSHHGTPEQRVAALRAGFEGGAVSIREAYEAGERFLEERKRAAGRGKPERVSNAKKRAPTDAGEPSVSAAPSAPFCRALNGILSTARRSFRPLRGAPDGTGDYVGTLEIPGTDNCTAFSAVYDCTRDDLEDEEVAQQTYEEFARAARSCLGPEWETRERGEDEGPKTTDFVRERDSVKIRVRKWQSERDQQWSVRIEVRQD